MADPQPHPECERGLCDLNLRPHTGPLESDADADADAIGNPDTHDDTEPDNEVWRRNRIAVFPRCTRWGNFRNILNELNQCTRGERTWGILDEPRRKTRHGLSHGTS
jgi:hypothetical protein